MYYVDPQNYSFICHLHLTSVLSTWSHVCIDIVYILQQLIVD